MALLVPRLAVVATLAAACAGLAPSPAVAAPAVAPSPDPYAASLAYARCMRAHGVPHPDPDAKGDFSLTPAQEKRMRSVPEARRKAADDACFHHLKGLNLKPLSPHAIVLATAVVADLGRCIRDHGYTVGKPEVKNLSRGRAFFGFTATVRPASTSAERERRTGVEHACEKQVDMAARISKIIDEDRGTRPANI